MANGATPNLQFGLKSLFLMLRPLGQANDALGYVSFHRSILLSYSSNCAVCQGCFIARYKYCPILQFRPKNRPGSLYLALEKTQRPFAANRVSRFSS